MSRSGKITLSWGDRDHTFRLGLGELEAVQEKCDAGPAELLARMSPVFAGTQAGLGLDQLVAHGLLGTWRLHDVREPIFQGLIGGGLDPSRAGAYVRQLVDNRPLLESVCIAYQILLAAVIGPSDETLDASSGEGEGEKKASPAENSPSGPSTEPAPSSA